MELSKYKRFCVVVLIIAVLVIITNLYVYASITKTGSLNSFVAQADVNLTIEPYVPPPVVIVTPGPSGGGGGGFPSGAIYDFALDQTVIKVGAKLGESFDHVVEISNLNNVPLSFNVSTDMEDFINNFEESFTILGKQSKNITFTFTALPFAVPDVYTGNIFFRTQYSEKKLPVIFEIQSKRVVFEVNLDIPARYKTLDVGDDLFFQVTIFSLAEVESGVVELEYIIKDFRDNVIIKLEEDVFVDGQVSFGKTISLPDGLPQGDYVILVKAKYDSHIALSSEMFSIGKAVSPFTIWIWAVLVVLLVLILLVYYELRKMRLKKFVKESPAALASARRKIMIGQLKKVDVEEEIKRLKRQRELLEEAHNSGYIKDESYEQSKKKIAGMIRSLREKYL